MRLITRSRIIFIMLVVIGSLLLSGVSTPVHAAVAQFIGARSSNTCGSGWFSGTCTSTAIGVAQGDLVLVHYECDVQVSPVVNDTFGDSFTILIHDFSVVESAFASVAGNLQVTVTATCLVQSGTPDGRFAVNIFRNIAGIGNVAPFNELDSATVCSPCTSTISLGVQAFSIVYEAVVFSVFGSTCATITNVDDQVTSVNLSCQALAPGFTGGRTVYSAPNLGSVGTHSYRMQITTTGSPSPNTNVLFHYAIELLSNQPTVTAVKTLCFGNCGNPAVTLLNSNSTKSLNFNTSITVLYEAQSTLNGFVNNVSISISKTPPPSQTVYLGLYIQTCSIGILPMTPGCPATLRQSITTFGPTKGILTLSAGPAFAVAAGDWIVLGVSALYAGIGLNDTNTGVPTFTASGNVPPVITSVPTGSSGFTMGMWAWVTGTVSTGPPAPGGLPSGPCVNNFAQFDCIIPGMVNSMCIKITASCQTSGALFWIIILTFLSFLVATVGFASAHITKFVGAGEVFLFLFLGWFFIFVGVGVLESFVVIFFLFIGSFAFAKTARNYF